MTSIDLRIGDCLKVMRDLPDSSVDLVLTDPPYFKVKGDAWDNQWDNPDKFLGWLDQVVEQCARVLRPNGSLYMFASPQMAARVECKISERLNILNHIVWKKDQGRWNQACKETLRGYFPNSERIIFAEQYGADNMAKGEAGYASKCDELRGFVFEPLRAYLSSERDAAGLTTRKVAEAFQKKTGSHTVTGMAGHWFEKVQWTLPTSANYEWLRDLFNQAPGDEYLRKDYEDLRREYEDLRRPFAVSSSVPYTDVWEFDTVKSYKGKHPCEKPQALLRHIIEASSRPGAVVLDCFMGTGSTGIACKALGRDFIGIEMSKDYMDKARERIENSPSKNQ